MNEQKWINIGVQKLGVDYDYKMNCYQARPFVIIDAVNQQFANGWFLNIKMYI